MTSSDGPEHPADRSGPEGRPPRDGTTGAAGGAGGGDRDRDRVWRRELGELVGELRRQGRLHGDQLDRLIRQVRDLTDEHSRLAPRVDDLDTSVAALGTALEGTGGGGAEGSAGGGGLTPATGWSQLSVGDKRAAWDALSGWVAAVLNGDYRLTRYQLPDCWPVHPRAVRELAWLRTLHLATTDRGARPEQVAEWHTRWLPAALHNLAVTIDPRECAPGRHRLTEDERHTYDDAVERAAERGEPTPVLTGERGPDRPRYLPARFPPRRTRDDDPPDPYARPRPRSLDTGTPAPPSSPDDWREYFLDARLADVGHGLEHDRAVDLDRHPSSGESGDPEQGRDPGNGDR